MKQQKAMIVVHTLDGPVAHLNDEAAHSAEPLNSELERGWRVVQTCPMLCGDQQLPRAAALVILEKD